MKGLATAAMLLASASSALAGSLKINNWMNQPIYMWIGNNAASRTVINPGTIFTHNFIGGGVSTSLKMSNIDNVNQFQNNVFQFEYTLQATTLWYDMSNINGRPYAAQNVKVSPTGTGAGASACNQLRCAANQPCSAFNAYTVPSDNLATHSCPANTGDMWIDIGEPVAQFNTRSTDFSA